MEVLNIDQASDKNGGSEVLNIVGCVGSTGNLFKLKKFAVIDSGIESEENGKRVSTSESSDISSEEGVGMCYSGTRESGKSWLSHELSHEDCARI